MTEPVEVVIGRSDSDCVAIKVLGRMHPGADDYWDGNWLAMPLTLECQTNGALGVTGFVNDHPGHRLPDADLTLLAPGRGCPASRR